MKKTLTAAGLVAASFAFAAAASAGTVLDEVKSSGVVVCGVNTAAPGFSNAESQGNWTGLDVDY